MDLSGIAPVIPTPFDEHSGAIDHTGLDNLADFLAESAVSALVALGVASETRALNDSECAAVVETAVASANVRKPVLAGVDGFTQNAVGRAVRYRSLGAAGIMLRPPPGCQGPALIAHVAAIAKAADLPIMIQNAPAQTGMDLLPGQLIRLAAAIPSVFAVKEESSAVAARTSALADAGLAVFTGLGGVNYPEYILRGAVGCVPGLDLAPVWLQIDQFLRDEQIELGLAEYEKIAPLIMFQFQSLDGFLFCQKRYFQRLGVIASARLRPPAGEADEISLQMCDRLFARLAHRGVRGFDPEIFGNSAPHGGQVGGR